MTPDIPPAPLKILFVDDSATICAVYQKMLEGAGYQVAIAGSMHDALEVTERFIPDISILDYYMPNGNGDHLAEALLAKAETKNTLIVIFTQKNDVEELALSAGAMDVIYKEDPPGIFLRRLSSMERYIRTQQEFRTVVEQQAQAKAAEAVVRREWLESVLSSIPGGLAVIDAHGYIQQANPGLYAMLGYSPDELHGIAISTLFVEQSEEEEFNASNLSMVNERLQRLTRQTPEALGRYCDRSPISAIVLDQKHNILHLNRAVEYLSAWEREALIGGAMTRLLPSHLHSCYREIIGELSESGKPNRIGKSHNASILTPDGSEREVEIGLFPLSLSEAKVLVIIYNPAEKQQMDLFKTTPLGELFVEKQNETLVSAEKRLQHKLGKPIPTHISGAVLYLEERVIEGAILIFHDLQEHKKAEAREQYAAFQSGVAEMTANILHNVGNTIQGMRDNYAIVTRALDQLDQVRDIYQMQQEKINRAQTEEESREHQQMMLAFSEKLPGVLDDVRHSMTTQSHSVEKGIEHIIEVIRAQQKGVQPDTYATQFSLQNLLDDLLILNRAALQKRDIQSRLSVQDNMPDVKLPRNQLLQALINLMRNSIDSIDEAVERRVLAKGGGWVELTVSTSGEQELMIEVKDNGNGIVADKVSNLFKFGYTTKVSGSGFGLHATGNFVSSCNGRISINSSGRGEGATVTIYLPLEMNG